jgi:hypothetical protein
VLPVFFLLRTVYTILPKYHNFRQFGLLQLRSVPVPTKHKKFFETIAVGSRDAQNVLLWSGSCIILLKPEPIGADADPDVQPGKVFKK